MEHFGSVWHKNTNDQFPLTGPDSDTAKSAQAENPGKIGHKPGQEPDQIQTKQVGCQALEQVGSQALEQVGFQALELVGISQALE